MNYYKSKRQEKANKEGKCGLPTSCNRTHDNRTHPRTGVRFCHSCADMVEKIWKGINLKLPVKE